jgi:hypothetical protein
MAQHDYDIANQTFPSFRSDLNSVLEAINTSNSGTSRPSSAVAGTIWLDTTSATTPTLKFYDGSDDISLATLDYSANTVNWIDSTVIFDIVNDTTPQLGGNLDVNGNSLVSTSNGNITFTPDGTGKVVISGLNYPTADGTADQVLKTDGSGNLSFTDVYAGLDWQTIVTGSTLTAVAGNAYWIDTTSNTCTITLPSSASNGDQIIFVDYARNWGSNKIIIDSNGLNYQGNPDTFTVEYSTSGQTLNIVYSGATQGWIPIEDDSVELVGTAPAIQKAIFGFGTTGSLVSLTNLVSSSGVVATDTTGVGTARDRLAAASYGDDKAIFAYGRTGSPVSLKNLVSNTGVVASDVTGVGTARRSLAAATYGDDKAIFGYGYNGSTQVSMTNLVSNTGVVASDVTGVGTARNSLAACSYGEDKAIFGYGYNGSNLSLTNLVTNLGVVGSDVTGVGTARNVLAAASYGGDKGIFGYGQGAAYTSVTNLVSNTGVVSSDTTGVGTARRALAASSYGGDKAIFGYGLASDGSTQLSITNLVNNSGVVASDTTGVGTARSELAAAGYSISA